MRITTLLATFAVLLLVCGETASATSRTLYLPFVQRYPAPSLQPAFALGGQHRGHAMVGSHLLIGDGARVLMLDTASRPALDGVWRSPMLPDVVSSIEAIGTRAFVHLQDGSRLIIFDLSRPASPVHEASVQLERPANSIAAYQDRLYLCDDQGLAVLAADDPRAGPRRIIDIEGGASSCDVTTSGVLVTRADRFSLRDSTPGARFYDLNVQGKPALIGQEPPGWLREGISFLRVAGSWIYMERYHVGMTLSWSTITAIDARRPDALEDELLSNVVDTGDQAATFPVSWSVDGAAGVELTRWPSLNLMPCSTAATS